MTTDYSDQLPDSAEAWLARLQSPECDARERAAFEDWRARSPTNAQAYGQVEKVHGIAAALASDPLLRAASLAGRRRTAQRNGRRRLLWLTVPAALAASVLLALGLTFFKRGVDESPAQHYASAPDQLQVLRLADGTRLILDADSAVTTHFDAKQRLVVLDHGRAEFAVAAQPQPFAVRVGANLIRDIGTTFQVSKEDDAITVGLLEGKVAIVHGEGEQAQTRTLAPEQQIRIASDGSSVGVQPLDVEAARAWPDGELVFRKRRLDELLTEMNRYSPTKLRLGDPSLASLLVSGSFHAGDQQALVKALQAGWSLRVETGSTRELTLYPAAGRYREN